MQLRVGKSTEAGKIVEKSGNDFFATLMKISLWKTERKNATVAEIQRLIYVGKLFKGEHCAN